MPARTIAVVDDDAAVCDILTEVLADAGYRPVTCVTPTDALATLVREEPCLMLLDLWLPDPQHGLALLRQLRATPATATVPVIVMSADPASLRIRGDELTTLGATVLAKPFDLEALVRLVDHLLRDTAVSTSADG
jgi:DNA-binding response OmpR family regulator